MHKQSNIENNKKIDAIFEGGGVKGSALVGGIVATEELGYSFENVAGTSAGAIIASLVAVGYSGLEIKTIMDELNYALLKDPTALSKIPLLGQGLSILFNKGIYAGDYIENWLREIFKKRDIYTFGDLTIPEYKDDPKFKYKLQVIASDITNGRLLVLPGDAKEYNIDPDKLDVAHAVRMSMSIPYFYVPIILKSQPQIQEQNNVQAKKSFIIDGGILSNFPLFILDDATPNPAWPTIGYKLVDPNENKPHNISGPITLFEALFETMLEAHDARYIEDKDFMRMIPIPTLGVQTTDFNIDQATKDNLYNAGYTAAKAFFKTWDFETYKAKYRADTQTRTERVWKNIK